MRRVDLVSLVAGLALCGLGVLLLLDQSGVITLGFGFGGPALLAAVGAILLASGLDAGRRE